ncbi:MAG: exodeoxyribonuclease VII large subunit [Fulvivirga sp.]
MTSHLTLYQLNNLVKQTLDSNLAPSYWVVAEISELRTNYKGHCYLELVEKEDEQVIAKTRATIWAYTYRNLSTWFEGMTGKALQPGLKILCNVAIQYHELYGFSVNIKDIDANFTLGERARKRKEIIDKLIADGVYEMNKMLSLPTVPQRIAVISSPTAAGYGDFMNQLEANDKGYQFNITLFKSTVQGDQAADSIIQALHRIHEKADNFDLVCLIRGGGSQIDLDCFDNYELSAHVAQFPLPVLTGIGHERDETICDLVAHTKLKTPTAVAEFLVNGMRSVDELLDRYFSQVYHSTQAQLSVHQKDLDSKTHRIKSASRDLVRQHTIKLGYLRDRLKTHSKVQLKANGLLIEGLENHLNLINPLTILERGYTLTIHDGKRLSKASKIKQGDEIVTVTAQRQLKSKVTQIKDNNE